jgi:hypothetical protein
MINVMEEEERGNPDLIAKSPSRRRRIAQESELSEDSVLEMISTFASLRRAPPPSTPSRHSCTTPPNTAVVHRRLPNNK